jgi:hypothetical protein
VVPAGSIRVSRVRIYSGTNEGVARVSPTGLLPSTVGYSRSVRLPARFVTPRPPCGATLLALQPRPRNARRLPRGIRFGLCPLSLATTQGIEAFFLFLRVLRCIISPGSLLAPYVFRCGWRGITRAGFPHSEIRASMPACGSTRLIAACHVLRRLPVPRHPPYALTILMVLDSRYAVFKDQTPSLSRALIRRVETPYHSLRSVPGPEGPEN